LFGSFGFEDLGAIGFIALGGRIGGGKKGAMPLPGIVALGGNIVSAGGIMT
jgi:hypothetical protein